MEVRSTKIVKYKGKWEVLYITAIDYFVSHNGKIIKLADKEAWKLYS